jgi:APA family basic amino acid/polyamine antiporter
VKFGAFSLTCLVVANTIGAGVYTTSGYTLAAVGTPQAVLAVWALAALLALSGAMSFAALSKAMPLSGGEYAFLSRLFHPAAGFIAGWVSLVVGFAGAEALGALAMNEYLTLPDSLEKALDVALLVGLAVCHGKLVRFGTLFQNLTVAAKALFLGGFILVGWAALPELTAPIISVAKAKPDFVVWSYQILMVGLSFSGYNAAIYVAEECRDPRRDVPRALFWGTAITALLYLAVNAVFLFSAPLPEIAGSPQIALISARALGGASLARGVQALVLLSLFTLLSGSAVSGPRVVKKMGEDGFLPPMTLGRASAVQCALAVLMTLYSDLASQLVYLSLVLALVEALTVSTVFRLPAERRPCPLFPVIFLVGTAITSAAALRESPKIGLVAAATILTGLLLYLPLRGGSRIPDAGDEDCSSRDDPSEEI